MTLLFVTWDGSATNYLEGLFLPTLARLRCPVHVLQFTSASDTHLARVAEVSSALSVGYSPVRVHRTQPLQTLLRTLPSAIPTLVRVARKVNAEILMPRSIVPAALVLGARPWLRKRTIFDADGLMPDERIDFAGWRSTDVRYRVAREVESQLVRISESVVVRTDLAKEIILARGGADVRPETVAVIPNAKDEEEFRPVSSGERNEVRRSLKEPGWCTSTDQLFVHVGGLGPQYEPRAMFRLFRLAHDRAPHRRLVVLTTSEDIARDGARAEGVPDTAVHITRAPADEVARILGAADVGLALRTPTFSQRAVCPIKVAEYLLSGLPLISNRGVGDLERRLSSCTGVHLMDDCSDASLASAVEWVSTLSSSARDDCRSAGLKHFSLNSAVRAYDQLLGTSAP